MSTFMSSGNGSFVLLSINHENVPLHERERYSLSDDKVEQLYALLAQRPEIGESLVLNTCNRLELYARLKQPSDSGRALLQPLSQLQGIDEAIIAKQACLARDESAVAHLIEVAAGLRSQIIGEAEIFGQVKDAYALCQSLGAAGKVVNRVAQKGFQAAKSIRHNTTIGQGQINISNVAVDLSLKIFGQLDSAAVLILGTGEIGEKTAKALRSRGAKSFGVASRLSDRASEAARNWGGRPHLVDELPQYLFSYDIVIASIGVEQPIVTRRLLEELEPERRDAPLFLVDLGLPRNIDAACSDFDNVFLYNLDDLAAIAEENLAERKQAIEASRAIAMEKSQLIWQALKKRGLV